MKKTLLFILAIIITQVIKSQDSDIQLELSSSSGRIFLGDRITLFVKIYDQELKSIFSSDSFKIIEPNMIKFRDPEFFTDLSPNTFTYSFVIEPIDTGILRIGPIVLEYQNKILQSNKLSIEIIGNKGLDYVLCDAPSKVKCNTNNKIQIKSSSPDLMSVVLRDTRYFKVLGQQTQSQPNTRTNNKQSEYIKTFQVRFISQGVIELTKENFLYLSPSMKIDTIKIEIE